MILCSACLLGINSCYNGRSNYSRKALILAKEEILIPVCPEQMGGLPTPRDPAERRGERVLAKNGADVTEMFKLGAGEVLKIAEIYTIKKAIMKQRSPSCGCGEIYDGTFSNVVVKGFGVTSEILLKHGIEVITEKDL